MRRLIPTLLAAALLGAGCFGASGPRLSGGGAADMPEDELVPHSSLAALEERLARLEARQGAWEQLLRGMDASVAAQFEALLRETQAIREQLDAEDRWIASLARRRSEGGVAGDPLLPAASPAVVNLDSVPAPAWAVGRSGAVEEGPGPETTPGISRWARSPEIWSQGADQPPGAAEPGATARAPSGGPPDPPEEGIRLYEVAYEDLKRGNYQLALINLRAFLDRYPGTSLSDNAQYWIGEAYYAQGQFEIAIEEFRKVIDEHPGEDKEPAAYYKVALAFTSLRDTATARRYLQFLVERFPETREARLAREQLDSF